MKKFQASTNILNNNENMQKKPPLVSEAPSLADLKNEMSALKDEVSEFKSLLQQLLNTQSKSNLLLESLLTQKETRCTFPIKTVDELYKTDEIVGQDPDLYIAVLKNILGKHSLNKKLTSIVSEDVILKLNYGGVKDMIPFKNLKNLNEILFSCLQKEGYDEKTFENDVRTAIKLVKGRYFKKQCLIKKNKKLQADKNVQENV